MLNKVKCTTCGDPDGFILRERRISTIRHTCFTCERKKATVAARRILAILSK
jgi:hypothetical protein